MKCKSPYVKPINIPWNGYEIYSLFLIWTYLEGSERFMLDELILERIWNPSIALVYWKDLEPILEWIIYLFWKGT